MNFDTDVLFNRFLRMRFDRISSPDECAARLLKGLVDGQVTVE